jgi:chaperonin cofactor prefoldin
MSNIQIEFDLKEVLGQINQKLEKLDDINVSLSKVETKVDSLQKGVDEIKGSQKAQIWTLIGILFAAVGGFLVAVGRFVLVGNP